MPDDFCFSRVFSAIARTIFSKVSISLFTSLPLIKSVNNAADLLSALENLSEERLFHLNLGGNF